MRAEMPVQTRAEPRGERRGETRVHTDKPMDELVRRRLREWPQRPPGAPRTPRQSGTWLRARPGDSSLLGQPFLKLPGSSTFRTIPDGLWLHFSPDPDDRWADIPLHRSLRQRAEPQDKRGALRAFHLLAPGGLPAALDAGAGGAERPDAGAGH
jgi:hypothetical protein